MGPRPLENKSNPAVGEGMNRMPKVGFSRTLDKSPWSNTKLVKSDMAAEIRKMKKESGPDMVVLGSGSIVAQLGQEGLIYEYQIALKPVVPGEENTRCD